MKTITLLLSPLLFILGLHAQEISSGSTLQQYSKPGAAIDMNYSTEKVDINESSDVNISLTTAVPNGTLSVLISIDNKLSSLKEFDNNLSFEIKPNQQNFLIDLQVKAQTEGLYYIRLLTKIS